MQLRSLPRVSPRRRPRDERAARCRLTPTSANRRPDRGVDRHRDPAAEGLAQAGTGGEGLPAVGGRPERVAGAVRRGRDRPEASGLANFRAESPARGRTDAGGRGRIAAETGHGTGTDDDAETAGGESARNARLEPKHPSGDLAFERTADALTVFVRPAAALAVPLATACLLYTSSGRRLIGLSESRLGEVPCLWRLSSHGLEEIPAQSSPAMCSIWLNRFLR